MLFSREKHLCLEKYLIRDYFSVAQASFLMIYPVRDYFQCCKSSSFARILRQRLFFNIEKHLCLKE